MFGQFFAQRNLWFTSPAGVWGGVPTYFYASVRQVLGYHPQVMRHHAQPNPALIPAVP